MVKNTVFHVFEEKVAEKGQKSDHFLTLFPPEITSDLRSRKTPLFEPLKIGKNRQNHEFSVFFCPNPWANQ